MELVGAYREALTNAGWLISHESGRSIAASYELKDRNLELEMSFFTENKNVVARAVLGDPLFASLDYIVYHSLTDHYRYVFSPTFLTNGELETYTEIQVMALHHHAKQLFDIDMPNKGMVLSPALMEKDINNPELLTDALREAQKLADVFIKKGMPAYKVHLMFKPTVVTSEDVGTFNHGVAIEEFWCLPKNDRQAKTPENCQCRTHFNNTTVEVIPRACK